MRALQCGLVLGALLLGSNAVAQDKGACTVQSTSRLDALINPVVGGDEKFFTTTGPPPNIVFNLATTSTMAAWPMAWPATVGCAVTAINDLGYDPNSLYSPMYKPGISPAVVQNTSWFDKTKYYEAPLAGYGVNFGGAPSGTIYIDSPTACAGLGAGCATCLATKGYYIDSATVRRVSGNFLNFYAPKNALAVSVLTRLIGDLDPARITIFTLNGRVGLTSCWGTGGGGPSNCLCRQRPMAPTCANSSPLDQGDVDQQRYDLITALYNDLGWDNGNCGTDLFGMHYAVDNFFNSGPPGSANDGFLARFGVNYLTSGNALETPTNKGSCAVCAVNAQILITDKDNENDGQSTAAGSGAIPAPVIAMALGAGENGGLCAPGAGNHTDLCSLAKYFYTNSIRWDQGPSHGKPIFTYTVGLAAGAGANATLQSAAKAGGGLFLDATNTDGLYLAIKAIISDIRTRGTAFSTSAVAAFQTGSALAAIVPRMYPQARGTPWSGNLFRFDLYNEFVAGATHPEATATVPPLGAAYIVDSANHIVTEDPLTGAFLQKYVAGTPPAVDFWNSAGGPGAAGRLRLAGHASRKIYTVRDDNVVGGDGAFTSADSLLEFKLANVGQLIDYLGIKGSPLCGTLGTPGTLFTNLGLSVTDAALLIGLPFPGTQSGLEVVCASVLIQYVRGQDLGDEANTNCAVPAAGCRTGTRASVMGDIFHSSPQEVTPPVEQGLCNLGLSNQCLRTLFSQALAGVTPTALASYSAAEFDCAGAPTTRNAYEKYFYDGRKREKVVLVGTNDGMLHAFHSGTGSDVCTSGLPIVTHDRGTGSERWAFIPPDLLSQLGEQFSSHTYFVDGDVMVRDIWADENLDGIKQATEFKTLAVAAEGRGGIHYFALQLKFDGTGAAIAPGFRWMFPQPNTPEASEFGKTLLSLSPKPPPVGPVLIDSTTPAATSPALNGGVLRYGTTTSERWMVMLSGGWSPTLTKGRGIYMVDAWQGQINGRKDNLWWKWEFDPSSASDGLQTASKKQMTHGITAPVAMVDYGADGDPRVDGFFDTALVGDLRGQLWLARLYAPGVLDATSKLISNWSAGRALEQDRYSASSNSVLNQWPFYYLTSTALQVSTGALRAFAGTGNRYDLLERNAGACRFDNPVACAKYGCKVEVDWRDKKLSRDMTKVQKWESSQLVTATISNSDPGLSECGGLSSTVASAKYEKYQFECGGDEKERLKVGVNCGQDGTGNFACRPTRGRGSLSDIYTPPSSSTFSTLGLNRFYGVWAYGGDRTFNETSSTVGTRKTASEFDAVRVTDRVRNLSGVALNSGDLVDTTSSTCTLSGTCTPTATEGDLGWFIEYQDTYPAITSKARSLEQKTAGGSALISSCVLWNSIYPQATSTPCSSADVAKSRFYQSDFVAGTPSCASSFKSTTGWTRYVERTVLAPPPEPATVIQISPSGAIRYSALMVEPGRDSATKADISVRTELLQQVYELPVSRELHICRHASALECVNNPP